jgi:hypothetical protein
MRRTFITVLLALSSVTATAPVQARPAADTGADRASAASFADVDGSTHAGLIRAVAEAGIAGGYPDGSFRPGEPVTRGQMATFLQRALGLPAGSPSFPDVIGSTHEGAIGAVDVAGIAGGYPDGTYRPDVTVSRGQMATFLQRGFDLPDVADVAFSDVGETGHAGAIRAVAGADIAGGFADGTFRAQQPVTRGQMATFLARALGLRAVGPTSVKFQTFPPEDRMSIPGPTGFYWHGGNPEIGQSFVLDEGFELTAVQIGVFRASILDNWRLATEQERAFGHDTRWSGTLEQHDMRVTVWSGPAEAFGDEIDVAQLRQILDHRVRVDLPITGYSSTAVATIPLPPTSLAAGHHLISFSSYGEGPHDLQTIYFWGRDNGANNPPGGRAGTCEYPDYEYDSYLPGRAYTRAQTDRGFPRVPFERGEALHFREHVAKASTSSVTSCDPGSEGFFNPGDLEVALLGR